MGKDLFEETQDKDMDLVLQTNVNSAFKVARNCLREMKLRGEGDIVNIYSIASHDSYARGAVYCASKHALLAMGKSLRYETHGQNIRVINISPGMVKTEFSKVRFRGDNQAANAAYSGMTPLTPQDIAWQVGQSVRLPRHINLDEIIILATDQAGATTIARS